MHIVGIIPLVYVPRTGSPDNGQVLTYFSKSKLPAGSIVSVPLGRRSVAGLVLSSSELSQNKLALKKSQFVLKAVTKVLCPTPALSEDEINFMIWSAEYFFAPYSLFAKLFVPAYLRKKAAAYTALPVRHRGESPAFSHLFGPDRFDAYAEIMAANTAKNLQTLLLFPEIATASRFYESLTKDLKASALLWSSAYTPKQDFEARARCMSGEFSALIGTRSAVTVSLPNCATVIIDDEANDGHKSWDMRPYYDVRPMVEEIVRRRGIRLVRGGLVPSAAAVHAGAAVPEILGPPVRIVDMRAEIREGNNSMLSRQLWDELKSVSERGEQAVLFINRLGEYTVVLCRDCGFVLRCPRCGVALITVRSAGRALNLVCRSCNTQEQGPDFCPSCRGYRFKALGGGTERLEEEVKKLVPGIRLARIDSRSESVRDNAFDAFNAGDIDVLIGTQMVIQPHVLRPVALSAIVSTDAALLLPEFRGEETVFQHAVKLRFLATRAMVWQTYEPTHRVPQALANNAYSRFIEDELALRKSFLWPPFSSIVKLVLSDSDQARGEREVESRIQTVSKHGVYGLLERQAPNGERTWIILLRFPAGTAKDERNKLLAEFGPQWKVDVDPVQTLK